MAPSPSSSDAQTSYLYDLKRLIEKSRENIKRVNEKIKEQAVLKRNQKREERAREYYEKGISLTDQGKLDEAREYFEKAIRITEHPEMAGYVRESQRRLKRQENALQSQENERYGQMKQDESSRRKEVEGKSGVCSQLKHFNAYHVNGKMTAAQRERLMREFRNCANGLMSNARCLTEGVDVPVVDMVAFLSPRRSLVDIVLRWTPSFRPLSAENKMDSRGLLSWLLLFVGRSLCALKPFGKERTSRAWHCPSSLSVFCGFPYLPPQAV